MANVDAAFALYELDEHRDDVAVVSSDAAHSLEIVEGHAHETGKKRLETRLRFAAAGRSERGDRPAMKRFFHDDDRRSFYALLMSVKPSELDRSLIGFAAGVAEEHGFHN